MDYILAYGFFGFTLGGTLILFFRSFKEGYWGKDGEDVKYQVFNEDKGLHHERN
jgi:hypothetical protein